MILSARTLRIWYPPPRCGVDECVQNCQVCREATPHLRVVHRRPSLLLAAIALCGLGATGEDVWPSALALAAASIVLWLVLRRRDRQRPTQCVRCLDRSLRERASYLIDVF